ncbi:MAG: hypothetical protein IV088_16240 [Hydrogenophaga sp.]|uniref:hypothetical protein n=1 Tax=Hydrogenophaga sp. TaxID=1904254 RepID=UPI0025BF0627|nr:hypothetical protein [Hydrogenophaga sp.]MBT9552401.1 hypothetical protein [Hydrogenophaga sp.]
MSRSRLSGQRERVLHLHHAPQGEEDVNIERSPLRVGQGQPAAQGLIDRSEAFLRMLALVTRVAPSRAGALLLGALPSAQGRETSGWRRTPNPCTTPHLY